MHSRILIVDNDPTVAENVSEAIAAEGYQAATAYSTAMAQCLCNGMHFDLVVLNASAGVSRTLFSSPVLLVLSRKERLDRMAEFQIGTDDYVWKPAEPAHIAARAAAFVEGRTPRARLSPRELQLLRYFVKHRGEILSKARLMQEVWRSQFDQETRTVDLHVSGLRKKLDPSWILTIQKMGYMFVG